MYLIISSCCGQIEIAAIEQYAIEQLEVTLTELMGAKRHVTSFGQIDI